MDSLEQVIQSERNKKKKGLKPKMDEMQKKEEPTEGKSKMSYDEMQNFMENGEDPEMESSEESMGTDWIWNTDPNVESQEVELVVNGKSITDPSEIKEFITSNTTDVEMEKERESAEEGYDNDEL